MDEANGMRQERGKDDAEEEEEEEEEGAGLTIYAEA